MKISRSFASLVFAVLLTRALPAQVGISAGASVPRGELADKDGVGLQVAAMVQDLPVMSNRGFRLEGAYNRFVRKGTIQHITERVFYAGTSLVVHPMTTRRTIPYLVGGVGVYHSSTSPRPASSLSKTDPGYTVGGGIQFRALGQKAFGEVRLYRMLAEPSAGLVSITAGRFF